MANMMIVTMRDAGIFVDHCSRIHLFSFQLPKTLCLNPSSKRKRICSFHDFCLTLDKDTTWRALPTTEEMSLKQRVIMSACYSCRVI
jgi:hypothetical protein